jgi:hypothetical protein
MRLSSGGSRVSLDGGCGLGERGFGGVVARVADDGGDLGGGGSDWGGRERRRG